MIHYKAVALTMFTATTTTTTTTTTAITTVLSTAVTPVTTPYTTILVSSKKPLKNKPIDNII